MAQKGNNTPQVDTTEVKEDKVATFTKEQVLQAAQYHVGQKAFIQIMPDKDFPMSLEAVNKRLGVKK